MPNELIYEQSTLSRFFLCVCNNSFNIFLGIQDFPENIKCCKCLTIIEASVNPVSKWVSAARVCILQVQNIYTKWTKS